MRKKLLKEIRRLLSAFLASALLVGAVPVSGLADSAYQSSSETIGNSEPENENRKKMKADDYTGDGDLSVYEETEGEETNRSKTEKQIDDTYLIVTAPATEEDVQFDFTYSLHYPEDAAGMDESKSNGIFSLHSGEKYTLEMVPTDTEYFLHASVDGDHELAQETWGGRLKRAVL